MINNCKNCGVFSKVETVTNRVGLGWVCFTRCKKCGRTGESSKNPDGAVYNWNNDLVSYEGKNES